MTQTASRCASGTSAGSAGARLAAERHGPGGPAGLQNQCGRATHGSVGSTPAPLRMKARRLAAAAVLAALAYRAYLRDRVLTWGATEAEARARLAGDELLEEADGVATR